MDKQMYPVAWFMEIQTVRICRQALIQKKMANFNMSRLSIGEDGNYRDSNGNIVGKKGESLSSAAWKYLAHRYGTAYANQASKYTKSGATFQNGKWIPAQKQAVQEGPSSAGGKAFRLGNEALKWIGDKTGWYKMNTMNNTVSDMAGMAGYFIPGVSSALSAEDAYNDLKKGHYGSALMNAAFAIPFVGNVGRLAQSGLKIAHLAKAASGVGKGANMLKKVQAPAQAFMNMKMAYDIPKAGKDLYDGYSEIKNYKTQYKPIFDQIKQARQAGVSENALRQYYGDSYDYINALGSRSNTFTGNLGTLYDIMKVNK